MLSFLDSSTISLEKKLDTITILTTSINAFFATAFSVYFTFIDFNLKLVLIVYTILFFNYAPLWWNLFFKTHFTVSKHIYLLFSFIAVFIVSIILGNKSNVHLLALVIVIDSMLFFGYKNIQSIFVYFCLTLLAFLIPILKIEIPGLSHPEYIESNPAIFRFSIEILVIFLSFLKMLILARLIESERKKAEYHYIGLTSALSDKNFLLKTLLHDIRGPLSSCVLALRNFQSSSEFKNARFGKESFSLLAVESGQQVIKEIIDNLSVLNTNAGKFDLIKTEQKLSEMIISALKFSKSRALEKGIQITFNENDFNRNVIVDRDSFIHQILGNLLSNCAKFTDPKTSFQIVLVEEQDRYFVEFRNKGHFDQRTIESERFSTSGTWGEKGSGIGLNIVSQFSRLNGISFCVENRNEFAIARLGFIK